MYKDENGYIVVETIGTFIPFVLLIASILSLVNIVTVQSRMHYALTQAANTLSMYSYSLEVTGVADKLVQIDNKANKVRKEKNEIISDIGKVFEGIKNVSFQEAQVQGEVLTKGVSGMIEDIIDNPEQALQGILNYGLGEISNAAFEQGLRPLITRYLSNGSMTGEEYLKSVNVINGIDGLKFYAPNSLGGSSTLIDEDGNVKLVVNYAIEYKFGALPLPFTPKLEITQTVKTKAWLNGSGKGYW